MAPSEPPGLKNVRTETACLLLLVLIEEALNASFSVEQLVFAREERMAVSADFDLDLLFGRAGFDHVAASAGDSGFRVNGMNALFHND